VAQQAAYPLSSALAWGPLPQAHSVPAESLAQRPELTASLAQYLVLREQPCSSWWS
jgi:hypothetical protein